MKNIEINREGKVIEYKRGHFYLTITDWPDGHCEIEIHECCPKLIYHSCDKKDKDEAKQLFEMLVDKEKECLPILDAILIPNKELPK